MQMEPQTGLGTEREALVSKGNLGLVGTCIKEQCHHRVILCGAFPISHWTFSCHRSIQFWTRICKPDTPLHRTGGNCCTDGGRIIADCTTHQEDLVQNNMQCVIMPMPGYTEQSFQQRRNLCGTIKKRGVQPCTHQ